MIELGKLKDDVLRIFETDIDNLGKALIDAVCLNDKKKFDAYITTVEGDLSKDYLQMIYQYYSADRDEKKQDFTPKCLAEFLGLLVGDEDEIVDLCAGSGSLTIQKWRQNPDSFFKCYELDEQVIPYLLFNLVVRNIRASVCRADALQFEVYDQWIIEKGEKYGKLTRVKSAL